MAEPALPAALLHTLGYWAQWPALRESGSHACDLILPIDPCMQALIFDRAQNLALAVKVEGPDGRAQGSAFEAWMLVVLGGL